MDMHFLQHLKDEDNVGEILGFLQLKAHVTGFASIATCTSASAAKPQVKSAANLFPTELLKVI